MRGNTAPYASVGGYPLPLGFNGKWAWLYRWFSGRPLNGHRYTDATGFRYGTMALDVSGHATQFQLLPGALRFLYARLPIMAILPVAVATWLWPMAMYYLGLAMAILVTWRVQRWRARWAFRRDVIEPVSAGASAVLKAKRVDGQGHTWVTVPADFRDNPEAKITLRLPLDFIGHDGDKEALVKVVAMKLALDELTPSWSLHGAVPSVAFSQAPKPPARVTFDEALDDVETMEDGAIMAGYGPRRKVETFSLLLESPHALINGGSGAGKSVLLAFMIGQFMRRGYGVMVLDAKFVSHMWLRKIPGVHYASEGEELHNALVWLDNEILRRARFISTAPDVDKAAASLVPLVAVLEEINGASNRLRQYWKSIKGPDDPALSPALTALANLANMGRELRVHIFMAGQSITAKSTGGPEGRESFGGRFLARASSNAWKMLAPQIKPAPVKRQKPGRWHVVVGDTLREFQVPFIDLGNKEASDSVAKLIEWATGGLPVPDVTAMIEGWTPGEEERPVLQTPGSEVPPPDTTTLSEYSKARGVDLAWLRRQIERRPEAPERAGTGAKGAGVYTWESLDIFTAQRLREPVDAAD